MDEEEESKAQANEPRSEEKQRPVGSYAKNQRSKEELDVYYKKLAERNKYMKRMSNRSRGSKLSDKFFVPSIGQKLSKEHIMKSIERKVMQMSKSGDELKAVNDPNAQQGPEDSRKITEQADDDRSKKMSLRSRKLSIKSNVSVKSPSKRSSDISTVTERKWTEDTKREGTSVAGKDTATIIEPIAELEDQKEIPDKNDYEIVRKMSDKSEYSKTSDFGKRDIENIMEAIKSSDMPKTDSFDKEKFDDTSQDLTVQSQIETESYAASNDVYKGHKSRNFSETESDEQNISELNFRISDTELTQLMHQANRKHVGKHIISRTDYMPLSEFERVVRNVYKCCLKSVTDLHELHLRRLLALPLISDIIARADPEYINTAHIIHMVWSIMSCLHHFQLRLKSGSNSLVMYTRQRMVDKCMDYYVQLIRMFKSNSHRIILSAIITFYKDGKLWDIEFACTDMIVALLDIYSDVEDGVNDLLNSAMYSTSINPTEAQKLMQVIYEVLRSVKWRKISKKIMNRLIFMLDSSISPKQDRDNILYKPLRVGIDLCIRHVINNLSNKDVMVLLKRLLKEMVNPDVTEQAMLNFGSLAAYAAAKYQMKSFHTNITPDLLLHISHLTRTENKVTFLNAMRVWLNLIDRNRNSVELNQPRIFFRGCQYKIRVKKKSNRSDRMFFKTHRNYFYELITDCFRKCSNSRIQTYVIFEMCAVILVEIPCGYTAATFTSIAMSVQEYALQIYTENLVKSHYLHATALSIFSLICYIHHAEVLYQYVTNIIDRRAEWAPHLSPPLRSKYEYALHHVLWNKPELFFEDWEARFGLWKCFRIKNKNKNKFA